MRVLVCGGRDFTDRTHLFDVLDRLHAERPFTLVIHGGATGADAFAGRWAQAHNIPEQCCPAKWQRYGKRAGILRNAEMLVDHKPQLVVAFPGGFGTADMMRRAREAKIEVIQPEGFPT